MAVCRRSDLGPVTSDRAPNDGNPRPWTAFSSASFRRLIIDSVRCGSSRHHREDSANSLPEKPKRPDQELRSECGSELKKEKSAGSSKLSELFRLSTSGRRLSGETLETKVEKLEEWKTVVKMLQGEDVLGGAVEVRRLTKECSEARTTLALLGAIPPLVSLLDSEDLPSQIAALYALLNLGIGNDANKASIVKAGAIHKMLRLLESPNASPNQDVAEAVVANFLGLSALDSNKAIIGSSGAIPFLAETIKDLDKEGGTQAKQDVLRALYNLSISPENISQILETGLLQILLSSLGDMEVSERVLSILNNVVSTAEGRKGVSTLPDLFSILIDALKWTDSPGCQEKASYILMVMAHKSRRDREAMIESGIESLLLELTLLGSTLSQKRASRILEILKVDKGKHVSENSGYCSGSAVSAPICGSSSSSNNPGIQIECMKEDEGKMSKEKNAVNQLVQQSLHNNMRRIVKRANLPHDFVPSNHLKSLTSFPTSKSLPF